MLYHANVMQLKSMLVEIVHIYECLYDTIVNLWLC